MLVRNSFSDYGEIGSGIQHAGRESLEHPIKHGYLDMTFVGG